MNRYLLLIFVILPFIYGCDGKESVDEEEKAITEQVGSNSSDVNTEIGAEPSKDTVIKADAPAAIEIYNSGLPQPSYLMPER